MEFWLLEFVQKARADTEVLRRHGSNAVALARENLLLELIHAHDHRNDGCEMERETP